ALESFKNRHRGLRESLQEDSCHQNIKQRTPIVSDDELAEEQREDDDCTREDDFQAVDIPEKITKLLFIDGELPNCEQVQAKVRNHKQNARYRQRIPVFTKRDRTEAAGNHCSHQNRREPRTGLARKY